MDRKCPDIARELESHLHEDIIVYLKRPEWCNGTAYTSFIRGRLFSVRDASYYMQTTTGFAGMWISNVKSISAEVIDIDDMYRQLLLEE